MRRDEDSEAKFCGLFGGRAFQEVLNNAITAYKPEAAVTQPVSTGGDTWQIILTEPEERRLKRRNSGLLLCNLWLL